MCKIIPSLSLDFIGSGAERLNIESLFPVRTARPFDRSERLRRRGYSRKELFRGDRLSPLRCGRGLSADSRAVTRRDALLSRQGWPSSGCQGSIIAPRKRFALTNLRTRNPTVRDRVSVMADIREHRYSVAVGWTGNLGSGTSAYSAYSRDHEISVVGKHAIQGSSDPAFRGDGSRWNPEEFAGGLTLDLPYALVSTSRS
jgi:hypothetical protein